MPAPTWVIVQLPRTEARKRTVYGLARATENGVYVLESTHTSSARAYAARHTAERERRTDRMRAWRAKDEAPGA